MAKAGGAVRKKTALRQWKSEMRNQLGAERQISFLLQDWDDAYNVGGLFRTADGLGANLLVMTGKTPIPENPMIGVTSLGAHRRVAWRQFSRHDEAVAWLKSEGFTLVAVELADGAISADVYAWPEKVCLILGNEGAGISPGMLRQADATVFLPMLGKGRSLNVMVAGSVVGYLARLAPDAAPPGS